MQSDKCNQTVPVVGYEGLYEVSDTGVIYPVRTQPPPPTGYLYIAGKVRHLALLCNKNDRLDIVDVGSLFYRQSRKTEHLDSDKGGGVVQ